jgi:perosamine synthetase
MSRPSFDGSELEAIERVLQSGWLGEGSLTREFEQKLSDYTGASQVVAVNTGTSALHLALEALGVGPGDEVILPSFTFVSDPMAVRMCGATPVFGDIDPETLNLDPGCVESLITEDTKAVMPTDYAGLPADVESIRNILGNRDIRIIRDASHSFGSQVGSGPVGLTCGEDATCFSFDPIKNLTCGEGGAVLVDNADWAKRLRLKSNLGLETTSRLNSSGNTIHTKRSIETGYRYHMGNLNACIGLAQFERFPTLAHKKRQVAKRYDSLLRGMPNVGIFTRDYDLVIPFIYPIRVPASLRDPLIERFTQHRIHADLRYQPCHEQPVFGAHHLDLPITRRVTQEVICLPIYADMGLDELKTVVDLIADCVQ